MSHHGHVSDDTIPIVFGVVLMATFFSICCCALCCVYCICKPVFAFLLGLCCGRRPSKCSHHTIIAVARNEGREYQSLEDGVAVPAPSAPLADTYDEVYKSYQTAPSAPPLPAAMEYGGTAAGYSGEEVPVVEAFVLPPLAPHSTAEAPIEQLHQPKFRDTWAAALFLINFSAVCTTAVVAFQEHSRGRYSLDAVLDTYGLGSLPVADAMGAFFVVAVFPFVLGTMWLSIVIHNAKTIIKSMLWFGVFTAVCLAVLFLVVGQFLLFVVMAVLCCLNVWYIHAVRDRIEFASTVLEIACRSIKIHYSGIMAVVSGLCILQLLWVLLWGAAGADVFAALQEEEDSNSQHNESLLHNNKVICFFLLVSLYWGVMLGNAIVECVVSGLVSCWWFQPGRPYPLKGSVWRAMTYSFGSLCLGSLIVSVVMGVRAFFRLLRGGGSNRRSGSNLVLACFYQVVDYILGAIESVILYFNKYAFSYVAAYGENFVTSGRNVMELFSRRYKFVI